VDTSPTDSEATQASTASQARQATEATQADTTSQANATTEACTDPDVPKTSTQNGLF